MPIHARPTRSRRIPGCHRFAALAISLPLSAALTAAAVESGQHCWLAWISLLPLFWAIRSLGPLGATLSGALWGGCLYAFLATGAAPAIPPALWTAALLTVVPGCYAASCSLLTRRIGFNPLILGLGWIAVEIALRPLGLDRGLLAGTQTGMTLADWVSSFFGYALVALLLVCANASLVSILSGVRLSRPACRSLAGSPNAVARPPSQVFLVIQSWLLRQAQPRAPPIQVVVPS